MVTGRLGLGLRLIEPLSGDRRSRQLAALASIIAVANAFANGKFDGVVTAL